MADLEPACGDFDGDEPHGIGLYDRTNSVFFLKNGLTPGVADLVVAFGAPTVDGVLGDWDRQ
jgi:hypothetical protein